MTTTEIMTFARQYLSACTAGQTPPDYDWFGLKTDEELHRAMLDEMAHHDHGSWWASEDRYGYNGILQRTVDPSTPLDPTNLGHVKYLMDIFLYG